MRWTKELQIHIVTVIHSNYNSTKPTGHLGSFSREKDMQAQISLQVDEGMTMVKCMRSRGQPFETFQFDIRNGTPIILGPIDDNIAGQNFINFMNTLEFKLNLRPQAHQSFKIGRGVGLSINLRKL